MIQQNFDIAKKYSTETCSRFQVQWLQQQVAKRRVKRGYGRIQRRQAETNFPALIDDSNSVLDTKWLVRPPMLKAKTEQFPSVNLTGPYNPNDPLWSDMWYLVSGNFLVTTWIVIILCECEKGRLNSLVKAKS